MQRVLLALAFCVSGAAALLFQVLWFRQVALSLGNTVWAGSLVLASFMGGLALGNALAARWRGPAVAALKTYARLETVVALSGLVLVLLLPRLPSALAPALGSLAGTATLNAARLGISFVLMLVPTTAMGATLPVLVGGLARRAESFGFRLGSLYGWNTLGAMAGAVVGEAWLVGWLGLTRTGLAAAGLNLLAAAMALYLARGWNAEEADEDAGAGARGARTGARALVLAAMAALIGGCGLALEVVWFRFLTMYVAGTSLTFALMLAVVLGGIALGGLAAGQWMRRSPRAHRWTPLLCAAAGGATTLSYAVFDDVREALGVQYTVWPGEILPLAAALMGPTCLLSGALFPLIGRSLRETSATPARAAGLLTLSNTTGAMVGALVGGFALLPGLGVERSLFAVSLAYAVAAAGLGLASGTTAGERRVLLPAGGLIAAVLALFPFGLMERVHVGRVATRHRAGMKLVQWKEGLTETSLLLRGELLGEPASHLLVTNGHPMSGTDFGAQRYMRLYVYWARAVHPGIRRAALISYGVGNTAAALVESPEIESIDVVDISRDIADLGRSLFPGGRSPLEDPRVRLHVEDGRFFLLTAARRYDLITSEPPPPRLAGVVGLYTREYFELVRDRLAEGGLITYWLPVHDLDRRSASSVIRGFCDAFPDCSLWTGHAFDWMLVGSRGGRRRVTDEEFSRQWRAEPTRSSLVSIGLDSPERLGALFQADALSLRAFVGDAPPLSDDSPGRILRQGLGDADFAFYRRWMAPGECRRRFETSAFLKELWPPALLARSGAFFDEQAMYERAPPGPGRKRGVDFARLAQALEQTDSWALPLTIAGTEPGDLAIAERAAARGQSSSLAEYLLGLGALSRRQFGRAADHFDRVAAAEPSFGELVFFRALSRCLAADGTAAAPLLAVAQGAADPDQRPFWASLADRCPVAAARH